jgi:hypothetical protein
MGRRGGRTHVKEKVLVLGAIAVFALGASATQPAFAELVPPTFSAYRAYPVASPPRSLAIGDVTGDGLNDVVMTTGDESGSSSSGDDSLLVFSQQPGGSLSLDYSLPTDAQRDYNMRVAIGDLDGDGHADVAVATLDGIDVFYQRDGKLASGGPLSASPSDATDLTMADINGDGLMDLVVATHGGAYVMSREHDAADYAAERISSGFLTSVAVGDLNGDGRLDVAGLEPDSERVDLAFQSADGSFSSTGL